MVENYREWEQCMYNEKSSCILRMIDGFVKEHGITICMRRRILQGVIPCYVCDWVGTDDRFYSIAVHYNGTMIFPPEGMKFTGISSTRQLLESSLRIFENKSDWVTGGWQEEELYDWDSTLQQKIQYLRNLKISVGDYGIEDVLVHVQPSFGVTVWYSYHGIYECFTAWCGCKTTVFEKATGLQELINKLGLSECVKVQRIAAAPLALEVWSDDKN